MLKRKEEELLDWSNKQSRILTANGKANDYFTKDQYVELECPHYHLQRAERGVSSKSGLHVGHGLREHESYYQSPP